MLSKKGKNANELLFRCSSLGNLMVDARGKSETISETTKVNLVDVFVSQVYKRQTQIDTKFTRKGNLVEEDSITIYSRITKELFNKNESHLKNEFISGTPDIWIGKSINEADEIIDIKSSWDIFTFHRSKAKPLNKMYYWQLQGYMDLSGAKRSRLVYCLADTPTEMIEDQKRRAFYKFGQPSMGNPNFEEWELECKRIDELSVYDDIPIEERFHETIIERNDEDIAKLYQRIKDCRDYMNEYFYC